MSTTRTMPPCPAWCDLPEGHPWAKDPADGSVSRDHERTFTTLEDFVVAELSAFQRQDADGVLTTEPPVINVYSAGDELTGTDARRFAVALLKAADALDAIMGGAA